MLITSSPMTDGLISSNAISWQSRTPFRGNHCFAINVCASEASFLIRILLNVQCHCVGRASIRSHNHWNYRARKSDGNRTVDLIQRRISWNSACIADVAGLSADCDRRLNFGIIEVIFTGGRAKAGDEECDDVRACAKWRSRGDDAPGDRIDCSCCHAPQCEDRGYGELYNDIRSERPASGHDCQFCDSRWNIRPNDIGLESKILRSRGFWLAQTPLPSHTGCSRLWCHGDSFAQK